MADMYNEKKVDYHTSPVASVDVATGDVMDPLNDDHEVFKKGGVVNFRSVSWPMASVIFLKIMFATGVLSIPGAMLSLGAVGGALSVIAWGLLNTYTAYVQGNFRNNHIGCHSIADMCEVVGGPVLREIAGFVFIIAYVLCAGSGILGVSIGLNALSTHATCTVWFSLVATIVVAATASIRKFQDIAWLTWAGFISIFAALLIVVIGVTLRDRPAAAPQTGPYELGYYVITSTTFTAGMSASATIFVSSAGTSAFLPVIAEMRNPKDYNKAMLCTMAVVNSIYLCFSLVVYRWCGQWVASPSLGSAGQTLKMVSYGIGLIGLIVSATLYLHVAAKYIFVRLLRNSPHLQSNSLQHWITWLSCTCGLSALAFILAEAIPIFNYLIALTGSVCFAPLAIIMPAWFWLYDHGEWKRGGIVRKLAWVTHWLLIGVGILLFVGATYATIQQIIQAYADGEIESAFTCADNSGST